MSTLQSMIDEVRSRIVEPSADFFDDATISKWLNKGYKQFCLKTKILQKTLCISPTANQYEYDLPTDLLGLILLRWKDQYNIVWRDDEEFARFAGFSDQMSDRPYVYKLHPWNFRIRFFPIPNTSAKTTTITAGGGISSADTSIQVADTTGWASRGRITIGSEQILYYATDSTHFLQCVRGDAYTTAASHANGVTVTEAPITMLCSYMPPDMATSSPGPQVDCRLPNWYDEAVISYATALCFKAKDKYATSDRHQAIYMDIMQQAMAEVVRQQQDRLPAIKDDTTWEVY